MRLPISTLLIAMTILSAGTLAAPADRYARPTSQPGDAMIYDYLADRAAAMDGRLLDGIENAEQWNALRPRYREEYFYMLGLSPMPERTPLKPVITRTMPCDGYVVDMLHYQSRPGLYVTANLYRPADARKCQRFPAILYVCGHSNMDRDGCKTAYQSFGIWFARHGYVCLVLDTHQLSEIRSIHHGTYREGRFWWWSRGYTPAGVECWNGIRGIDYLVSRDDVDPERIAVTGLSGGGAATHWIAAADDRIKAAVAVSGMSDLQEYVAANLVNGHCDCMFMYNVFQWPWGRIPGLIAPRPLLFVNSDNDRIFPMRANHRIANRMEMFYRLFGAGDLFDAFVSIGGHAYREDIRKATYRFMNTHLKNDPRQITDSEVDVVVREEDKKTWPIYPEKLRVFPTDADIPADAINTRVDERFVPLGSPGVPKQGEYDAWRDGLVKELRRVSLGAFPAKALSSPAPVSAEDGEVRITTEPGITIPLRLAGGEPKSAPRQIVLLVAGQTTRDNPVTAADGILVVTCWPRGTGPTRWTRTNPPNTVERASALIGLSPDAGRVWDVVASARWLADRFKPREGITLHGNGSAGVIGAYAALLEPSITAIVVKDPPVTHMDVSAPQILNVLRVCDIPEALGMLAPRPLTIQGQDQVFERTAAIYRAAGAGASLKGLTRE